MNNKYEIGIDVSIKYIMFKKRTEKEVENKLLSLNFSQSVIKDVLSTLKENGYIDDEKYVQKYFEELKRIKNWSAIHVKQDLYNRGCKYAIDEQELLEYEVQSIKNLYQKFLYKYVNANEEEKIEFIQALRKKGFLNNNIKKVIDVEV